MKHRRFSGFLAATLCVALVLAMVLSTVYADPGDWYLPWSRYDHNSMNQASLFDCDVTYYTARQTVYDAAGASYTGYWHVLKVWFDYPNGPDWLYIVAPADGTVVYSQADMLDVKTEDGDLYELDTYGSSQMYEYSNGYRLSAGETVGKVYLKVSNPYLEIQYVALNEPTYLFGMQSRYFVDGADLTDYYPNTYDTGQTSGSSTGSTTAKADLFLENMTRWGGVYDAYAYKPGYPISFNAVVKLEGSLNAGLYSLTAGEFTIRWTVTGANDYQYDQYIRCEVNNPQYPVPPEFVWTPPYNGTFWIYCKLDPYNDIYETDEGNNDNWSNPWEIYVDDFTGDSGVTVGN